MASLRELCAYGCDDGVGDGVADDVEVGFGRMCGTTRGATVGAGARIGIATTPATMRMLPIATPNSVLATEHS